MNKLIFATHNTNKSKEIKDILGDKFDIKNLSEIGIDEEIPETGNSFKENALQKVKFIYEKTKCNCFADDSGLCVDILNGAPGIFSARYAGEPSNAINNMNKLLTNLKNKENRKAFFITTIAAILDDEIYFFEGKINGKIIDIPKGNNGFGYDPIFVPEGYDKTFAELPTEIKNMISHRAIAMKKFCDFLKNK